jgi:hypothetical protein
MTGNRKHTIIIQERDKRLFRELGGIMRVTDSEQAKLVAGFNSTTRANTRLLALTQAGLLKRIFVGTIDGGRKALYALTPKSNSLVDVKIPPLSLKQDLKLAGNLKLEHQMQINSVFVTVKYWTIPVAGTRLVRWIAFREPLTQGIPLIPDGYFEIDTPSGTRTMFLEVDLGTEPIRTLQSKALHYVQLAVSGEYSRLFAKPQFRVLVLTTTEKRMHSIRSAVLPVTDKIFWFSTLENINRENFWSPVWLRPPGNQKHSLL